MPIMNYNKGRIEMEVQHMKIAVTYEQGEVFQHFGHTSQFKIYEIEDNEILSCKVVDTEGSGHGALASFLVNQGVNVLICGGIGGGAKMALEEANIKLYGGVVGNADVAVASLLTNTLVYNTNVTCSHHDHEHGDTPHQCGSHGCGSSSCEH